MTYLKVPFETKSNQIFHLVSYATRQKIFHQQDFCSQGATGLWFPHSRLLFCVSTKKREVMMYLIDHNIIRLFSLLPLFCPCSSLKVHFWPWWKLALSIFKQTQKDNEWQKQVVLLLHDGTDDMFFSKATIHNPLFYKSSHSLSSQFLLLLCHLSIFFDLQWKRPFFRVFVKEMTLVFLWLCTS